MSALAPDPSDKTPEHRLAQFRRAAEHARASYKWQEAIEHYTVALTLAGDQPTVRYDLLDGRAECLRMLGDYTAEVADLEAMAELARAQNEPASQVQVAGRLAFAHHVLGNLAEGEAQARAGLTLARQAGDVQGEAYCLTGLARNLEAQGQYDQAQADRRSAGRRA
jgi:tetratricopeptide (TPR) repeat protein